MAGLYLSESLSTCRSRKEFNDLFGGTLPPICAVVLPPLQGDLRKAISFRDRTYMQSEPTQKDVPTGLLNNQLKVARDLLELA